MKLIGAFSDLQEKKEAAISNGASVRSMENSEENAASWSSLTEE